MDFSITGDIANHLKDKFQIESEFFDKAKQPYLLISSKDLLTICDFLIKSPAYYFDFLNCITAIDNGLELSTIDLIYHITSIPFEKSVILKVQIDREIKENAEIDSVSGIWKTADWHEREIFDFYGVKFNNHPDLRRILLPADWIGHPMRKDYQEQETYHGIKVKY